jgi:hypothetical protein
MTPNLKNIAAAVAKMDNPAGRNEDIIATQTTLSNFAILLRAMSSEEAILTLSALIERSGKRKPKKQNAKS